MPEQTSCIHIYNDYIIISGTEHVCPFPPITSTSVIPHKYIQNVVTGDGVKLQYKPWQTQRAGRVIRRPPGSRVAAERPFRIFGSAPLGARRKAGQFV